jgi:hypothetical protein
MSAQMIRVKMVKKVADFRLTPEIIPGLMRICLQIFTLFTICRGGENA